MSTFRYNALNAATARGHTRVVRVLLEKTTDVGGQNIDTFQMIETLAPAFSLGHEDILQRLLAYDADPTTLFRQYDSSEVTDATLKLMGLEDSAPRMIALMRVYARRIEQSGGPDITRLVGLLRLGLSESYPTLDQDLAIIEERLRTISQERSQSALPSTDTTLDESSPFASCE